MTNLLILKLVHVIAVIIFLGNLTIAPFWKAQADRSKDRIKIAYTLKCIIRADRFFTMPAVTLLIIFGIGSGAGVYNFITNGWILWSIILLVVSAGAFMAKVVPLQKKMLALADDETKFNWDLYSTLSKQWDLWGSIATIAPWIAVVLMILKTNF